MLSENSVPNRQDWDIVGEKVKFDKLSKERLYRLYVQKTLLKTQKMFDYEGLPKTIPKRFFELILQTWGFIILKQIDGEWYGLYGGLGGTPDAYYQPTIATVANPYLKYSATLEIDKDCIVIRNDALRMGLMPMIERYAYLQAETDISFKFMAVNTRVGWTSTQNMITQEVEMRLNPLIVQYQAAIPSTPTSCAMHLPK